MVFVESRFLAQIQMQIASSITIFSCQEYNCQVTYNGRFLI